MIIYKDLLTEDELLTDTYKIELIDSTIYKVTGKHTTEKTSVSDSMFGGNASAEGQGDDEGGEDAGVSGINIVLAHRLNETAMEKKDFKSYIQKYMKEVLKKLAEDNPTAVDEFKTGCGKFIKEVLLDYKEYQFFLGENFGEFAMPILCKWDEETPYLYYFKHGLIAEKV